MPPRDPSPPADRSFARPNATFATVFAACFLLTLIGSLKVAEVRPLALVDAGGRRNIARFVSGMFPPDLSPGFLKVIAHPVLETIQLSVAGIVVAILIGLPLGVLATSTVTFAGPLHEVELGGSRGRRLLHALPYVLARGILSLFRSIPEFVWAFMFVRAVGLGPLPGVLAIAVAYGGMLGKVYSEILEGVNPKPLEALLSTGAGRLHVVLYGILPQAFPNFLSYTLYRWECAVRASAILGFVGAGGIGQQIEVSLRMFNFHEVLTELAILFLLVAAVDWISVRLRRTLLGAVA